MGKYFGTDGIRGVANDFLSADLALKVGEYLGHKFKGKKLIIGKDTRISGDMLEHALASGAMSKGADVYLLGVCATPALAYVLKTSGFAGGIMISASHNPYYDNGLKCFNDQGMKLSAELEAEIEDYIEGNITLDKVEADALGRIYDYSAGLDQYLAHLESIVTYPLNGYKIVLDLGHGSAVSSAEKLFTDLGADVVVMNGEPNGININVDSGSTHMDGILAKVVETKADMGFAFDGDADRCLAVDHLGNLIDGDKILYLLGVEFKKDNHLIHNTVVSTVMANLGFLKSMEKAAINVVTTDVGDKHVYANMHDNGFVVGGEQSGHIILSEFATTGDGVLTALKCAEVVAHQKSSLYELTKDCVEYPQILKNVVVESKDVVMNHVDVLEKIESIKNKLGTEGRILVRPSGTEPLVRVMVEAQTIDVCELHVEEMIAVIETL